MRFKHLDAILEAESCSSHVPYKCLHTMLFKTQGLLHAGSMLALKQNVLFTDSFTAATVLLSEEKDHETVEASRLLFWTHLMLGQQI